MGSAALLKGGAEEKQRPGAASLCVPVGDTKGDARTPQALPFLPELTLAEHMGVMV